MANIVNPICGVPDFQLPNAKTAAECGRVNGYIVAGLVSIGVIIGFIYWYNSHYETETDPKTGKKIVKTKPYWIIILMVTVLLLIWLFLPILFAFLSTNNYRTLQLQKDELIKRGYNEKEVLRSQQDIYQNKMQARSRIAAAGEIANAINMRNNNNFF